MNVFLMRSVPGAGKTTWVKKFMDKTYQEGQKWIICSADHYRMKDGLYVYLKEEDKKAHDACFRQYLDCLRDYPFTDYLIVDNTNSTIAEIAPYYRLAEFYDVNVKIVQIDCPFDLACKRNTHNVPATTIWRMHQNLLTERLPGHWKVEIHTQDMLAAL